MNNIFKLGLPWSNLSFNERFVRRRPSPGNWNHSAAATYYVWLHYILWQRSIILAIRRMIVVICWQGRINVQRGPWHIIGRGAPWPPQLPNGILDTEFSKIKNILLYFMRWKVSCVFTKKKNYTSIIWSNWNSTQFIPLTLLLFTGEKYLNMIAPI
jgi:hypothetical protein